MARAFRPKTRTASFGPISAKSKDWLFLCPAHHWTDCVQAKGEEMKPASRRWTSDEKAELDRLLDAGKEAAEIAVAINRTRQAIYARLQRLYRKRVKPRWLVESGLKAKK
jgi:hypothetical protein